MTSILLVAERDEQGEINQSTLQAIAAANGLLDAVVTVAISGEAPASASALAVEKIVTLAVVSIADEGIYDQATAEISALVESTSPEVVIFCKSDFGSIVGARLAFRSDSAFAADCIEI